MNAEDVIGSIGWGAGWSDAVDKLRDILLIELDEVDQRLAIAREDFSEEHPCVVLVETQRRCIMRIAQEMDILLPGMWGKTW